MLFMKPITLALLFGPFLAISAGAQNATQALVEKRLKETVLPYLLLSETDPDEAMEFMRVRFEQLHPEGKGISLVRRGRAPDPINLHLANQPFDAALTEFCDQAGLIWNITEEGIIEMKPGRRVVAKAEGKVKANAIQKATQARLSKTTFPAIDFESMPIEHLAHYLRHAPSEFSPEEKALPINIIVRPELLKKDGSLSLQAVSDPGGRRFSLDPSPPETEEPKLTLKLKDVSMDAALDTIASLHKARWHISEHGNVIIAPKPEPKAK